MCRLGAALGSLLGEIDGLGVGELELGRREGAAVGLL